MTTFETKTSKIKTHLLEGKSITSWEAINLYRCTRLAAIIKYIETRYNVTIARKWIHEEGTKYVRYWLTSDPALKEEIKAFMLRGNMITDEEARRLWDCECLNVVVNELREEGINVIGEWHKPLCGAGCTRYYIK